jgi:hypothetical protein
MAPRRPRKSARGSPNSRTLDKRLPDPRGSLSPLQPT